MHLSLDGWPGRSRSLPPPSQGSFPSPHRVSFPHHSGSRASVCVCTECSTEACGRRMAALLALPQGLSREVKIGHFCFAITAASMVTACDITGKVICGLPSWKERDGVGAEAGGGEGSVHARAQRRYTHDPPHRPCHVLSPGSGLSKSRCSLESSGIFSTVVNFSSFFSQSEKYL